VVLRYSDHPVKDPKDLSRQVAATGQGKYVPLTVLRDGQQRKLTVDIGDQARGLAEANAGGDDANGGAQTGKGGSAGTNAQGELGIAVQPLDAETRAQLGLARNLEGVLVRDVQAGGRAAAQGIRPGDVIAMVNQRPARSAQVLVDAVAAAKREKRGAISLLILRGDAKRFVAIPLS
jgi:serine protease Do